MTMPFGLKFMLAGLGIAIALVVVDLADRWMESRGWIYWRKKRPLSNRGLARTLMFSIQELVEPEIRHVAEDRDQRKTVIAKEDGAPP